MGDECLNYYGMYHMDVRPRMLGLCDAPQISKGRMSLAGTETATEGNLTALVYGNLRNRSSLADELDCTGRTSPARVLLEAYKKWGDACFARAEGGCVCCIADVDRDVLLISRDRMGECELFYAWKNGKLMFSDDADALLKSSFIEPVLDGEGICEIFGLGPARTPGKTPLRGIRMLRPGRVLVCTEGGVEERKYFELECTGFAGTEATAVEHVRALLETAVQDCTERNPGCMLSGGLDSTALTALLCKMQRKVKTFSVDYIGNDRDFVANAFRPEADAPYVRIAAQHLGTEHHTIVLSQDALAEGLDAAMRMRGFPGMGDVDSSLMLFAREIAKNVSSVISGECGDEVFGGYPWFRPEAALPGKAFPWSGSLELRERILRPELREKLRLREYVRDALHRSLDSYDSAAADPEDRALFKLQRLCFDYFMPNLQERASKICGAYELRLLTPLCDDRLASYVYNVPWRIKRMGGVEKGLYREAVRDLLPEALRNRKKSPYPKTCSAAYTEAVRRRMRQLCTDEKAPLWQVADRAFVEKLLETKLDPAETPWYGQLMAGPQMIAYLLQIDDWMRERGVTVEI